MNISSNRELIRFQNKLYANIQSMISDGFSFDEALISHFFQIDMGHIGRKLENELQKAKSIYQVLAGHLLLRDVRDEMSKIMDSEFNQYYFREIALRGNLAAASDILRLHVIQHYGGMYVDCDTLPSLGHVFMRTDSYCSRHDISFSFIDVLKSELYLEQIAKSASFSELGEDPNDDAATRKSHMQAITDHIRSHYGKLIAIIEQYVKELAPENAFKPLS